MPQQKLPKPALPIVYLPPKNRELALLNKLTWFIHFAKLSIKRTTCTFHSGETVAKVSI